MIIDYKLELMTLFTYILILIKYIFFYVYRTIISGLFGVNTNEYNVENTNITARLNCSNDLNMEAVDDSKINNATL